VEVTIRGLHKSTVAQTGCEGPLGRGREKGGRVRTVGEGGSILSIEVGRTSNCLEGSVPREGSSQNLRKKKPRRRRCWD